MKAFNCESCGSLVFFDNVMCVACGHILGFLPSSGELAAIQSGQNGMSTALSMVRSDQLYKFCSNGEQYEVCNWMIPAEDPNPFCISCRLNTVIPCLSEEDNWERWHKLELAKRRVIYTIMRLQLPLEGAPEENRPPLRFSFIGGSSNGHPHLTGHLNGLIVINVAEADDQERERRRVFFHEPYRTLLGHLRHEVAHYYWDRLIARSDWLPEFRKFFGDETVDYERSLQQYYTRGAPPDWQSNHVSSYASAHPWEDWAETWAHYFHIMDMVETAESFGIILAPKHPAAGSMTARPRNAFDVDMPFEAVLENWFPLTYALNSLNRGMGSPDIYPFVLSGPAIEKLQFIHHVAKSFRANSRQNVQ